MSTMTTRLERWRQSLTEFFSGSKRKPMLTLKFLKRGYTQTSGPVSTRPDDRRLPHPDPFPDPGCATISTVSHCFYYTIAHWSKFDHRCPNRCIVRIFSLHEYVFHNVIHRKCEQHKISSLNYKVKGFLYKFYEEYSPS